MKRYISMLLAVVLLLSACSTTQLDSAGTDETKNTALETQNGTTDTTEGTTTAESSGETNGIEATQGTDNTEGSATIEGATTPSTGNSDPTQGSTKPTTGSTEPTQGTTNTPPTTGTTDPTEGGTTKPTTGTTTTEPTTQPTTPTQPTAPTTPTKPAETLKINTKNDTIVLVGETLQIDYTYSGNKNNLSWELRSNVASVNNQGVVTGKAEGSCVVTVTDINGQWAMVSIVVEDPSIPDVTSIELRGSNAPLYDGVIKYAGDYMDFEVSTRPYESNRDIIISSSNPDVVSVYYLSNNYNGKDVTLNFKSAGTATVTIASADGCVSTSYRITVKSGYACNPGSGQLTPEQFVNCYNGVVSANGMSTNCVTGYLVLTLSDAELTWANARQNAEGDFHHWYSVGKSYLCLTYEGTNADGKHVFHVHR